MEDSPRDTIRKMARRLGEMLAAEHADFYDVVESFTQGYGVGGGSGEREYRISRELAALNALRLAAAEVIDWRVEEARDERMSWSQIGGALEMSKQAAQQKYGTKDV